MLARSSTGRPPDSTLFPYTTLFRSPGPIAVPRRYDAQVAGALLFQQWPARGGGIRAAFNAISGTDTARIQAHGKAAAAKHRHGYPAADCDAANSEVPMRF